MNLPFVKQAAAFGLFAIMSTGLVFAQGNDITFQSGVRCYKAGEYKNALNYFQQAEKDASYDFRPLYYRAMCYQKMGQIGSARQAFATLINRFPDSEGAELARKALAMPSKKNPPMAGAQGLSNMQVPQDILPKSAELKGQEVDGRIIVAANIGGKEVSVVLDSERSESVLGMKVAEKSNLSMIALGGRDGREDGIYSVYDVTVGGIKRPQMPIYLSNKDKEVAVLGRDFLSGYKVAFDKDKGLVRLDKIAGASNPFASAMTLYNKGKYKEALPLFRLAVTNRPQDPRPLYCLANCLQRAGYIEQAKTAYRQVRKRFGNSEASFLAGAALETFDPAFRAEMRALEASQRNESGLAKTKEDYFDVPYVVENSRLRVTAYFDNVPVQCYFEFNEPACVFSTDQIKQVDANYLIDHGNVTTTSSDPTGQDNQQLITTTWQVRIKSIRLGKAEARDVPANIIEYRGLNGITGWSTFVRPLLCGSVLRDYRYEIETTKRVLRIWKNK